MYTHWLSTYLLVEATTTRLQCRTPTPRPLHDMSYSYEALQFILINIAQTLSLLNVNIVK